MTNMRMEMKLEKMSQKALDRKNNKPVMEKKRRARINHCLNQLKALILETDSERSRHSKLEKADILEMTVRYLQTLRTYHMHIQQLNQLQTQQQQQLPAQHLQTAQQQQHAQQQQQQHQAAAAALFQQHAQLQLQLPLQLTTLSQQSSPSSTTSGSDQSSSHQMSPAWRPW